MLRESLDGPEDLPNERRRQVAPGQPQDEASAVEVDILLAMSERSYRLVDLGDQRVLTVSGREYPTRYSERVLRLLIERKGIRRTPPYLTCKETRGPRYLGPLFAYLGARGVRGLRVLEVGCSFGHLTEYLAEQPEVTELRTFDTDRTFVEIVRAKVDELRLRAVREVPLFTNDGTRRLRWADGRSISSSPSASSSTCRSPAGAPRWRVLPRTRVGRPHRDPRCPTTSTTSFTMAVWEGFSTGRARILRTASRGGRWSARVEPRRLSARHRSAEALR